MNLFVRNFNIRIIEKDESNSFFSTEGNTILDIKSDTSLFNTNAASILADPFLFVKGDELFLFYEHQDKWVDGKGRICMRKTKDLKKWTDEVDVLIEPFHLSFPWVFEEGGKVYMLPETGGDYSIRLYEATDKSLSNWHLVKKLMESPQPWSDTIIYKKDSLYYLFSSHDVNSQQEQHLFTATSLLGPYTEHPSSPIYVGRDGGRNAGSLIDYNGELYRPVQVCISSYGEQTSIMKVLELSPTSYSESLYASNIIDRNVSVYKEGGHQFNPVYYRGKWIVATDNRIKNYNIVELFRKMKKIITRIKKS